MCCLEYVGFVLSSPKTDGSDLTMNLTRRSDLSTSSSSDLGVSPPSPEPPFSTTSVMPASFISFLFLCLAVSFVPSSSQNLPTLDQTEFDALKSLFSRWSINSSLSRIPWNVSGTICDAGALGDFRVYDNPDFNPGVLCDCSSRNGTLCHITRLKARELGLTGHIPGELERFTYLDNLDIARNYLSGPLPAYIGNFSYMKYLSIGINALSGTVPKELGKLQNLISLGMNANNLSGSLPPELGNMTSLEQIYVDGLGLSGEIPASLSQLHRLKFMVASDNYFVGQLPDFIGNLSNLQSLRLHGNSLAGPIPSSFSNLNKLTELRLGDLINGSSSLAFLVNLKSLSILVLRNCRISDEIPPNIEEYKNLKFLDLSFNNISGVLLPVLFNLDSLESLFLGNNSLTGSLPDQKSSTLTTIDLSYNELSGRLPSWINDDKLQLNLVANNFLTLDSAQRGLSCLQKNIPCYYDSPVYYSFAINCGGPEITSSDNIVYDEDNFNLSSESYYVTDGKRWAVSSVGNVESSTTRNTESVPFKFNNTSDSELYQTARVSPSSLRYYGLGLENGNYSVKLQFAEIDFPDNHSWLGLGRRVFDIYIQGNLVAKNFDIRKEAGGTSFTAVQKHYITSVTDNFLEIHFFWAGKGTTDIPVQGYYGPLISAISVTPNFKPTVSNYPPTHTRKLYVAIVCGTVAGFAALGFLMVLAFCIWRHKRHLAMNEHQDLSELDSRPRRFSYSELRTATSSFSPANKLGEGGFGPVYKGKLSDGRVVAVKQLSEASSQGKSQFISEIRIISSIRHQNLVKLHGFYYGRKKRLLVYEYLENKSLDLALFSKRNIHLDWATRFEICLGTARGLSYLHEESRLRIVHRDVKASNILLDSSLNPKISDFGLAKLYDDRQTHIITKVAGTIGYLAPEYAMRGHLTEKVDVFSFGVVALELVCGRLNTDSSLGEEKMYLLEWAWHMHEKNADLEMVDPSLVSFDREQATRVIGVALLCTQAFASLRPPMSRVVAMLVGDVEIDDSISKPGYLADWQYDDASGTSITAPK